MNKRRPLWHGLAPLCALAGALSFAAPHPIADACSVAGPSTPGFLLGLGGAGLEPVPANAVGLDPSLGELVLSQGARLYRIPPGTTEIPLAGGASLPVSEVPDTRPPTLTFEGARRTGGSGCDGCAYGGGGASTVTLAVSAEDDQASAARITYALYFGETAEAALAASEDEPELWILPSDTGVWFFVDDTVLSGFVTVRAFDQAGNASDAADPLRIER